MAAAGFLVFIIVLAVIKYIVFALVFIFTTGKLKLWIFPNLTEDVGFFESFWPIYVYTYDKPKKAKDSDDEESSSEEEEDEDEKGELLFDIQSVLSGRNLEISIMRFAGVQFSLRTLGCRCRMKQVYINVGQAS